MIGSTNAKTPQLPREWNLQESIYEAGEDIAKGSPVAVRHRFTSMEKFTLITNRDLLPTSYASTISISFDSKYIVGNTGSGSYDQLSFFERNEAGDYSLVSMPVVLNEIKDKGVVRAIRFSENMLLIGTDQAPYVHFFNYENGVFTHRALEDIVNDSIPSVVYSARFSKNGDTLVLGGNNFLRIYRMKEGKYQQIGTDHSVTVTPSNILYSDDYDLVLAVFSTSPNLRGYKINSDDTISPVSFNSSPAVTGLMLEMTKDILIVGVSTTLSTYKYDSDTNTMSAAKSFNFSEGVSSMSMTPDKKYLVVSNNQRVNIYYVGGTGILTNISDSVTPSLSITGGMRTLFTYNDEFIVITSNTEQSAYRLNSKVFKVNRSNEFAGSVECIGYAMESKSQSQPIKILELKDFDIMSKRS